MLQTSKTQGLLGKGLNVAQNQFFLQNSGKGNGRIISVRFPQNWIGSLGQEDV